MQLTESELIFLREVRDDKSGYKNPIGKSEMVNKLEAYGYIKVHKYGGNQSVIMITHKARQIIT